MSLGKKTKFDNSNTKFYNVTYKNKNKDTGKSCFTVSTKGSDKRLEHLDNVFDLSGRLIKIEHKVTEWEGKKFENINYFLKDNNEIYVISFPFSIATRAFFNATLSLTSFEGLSIGTYMTRPKENGGKSYPALSLRQNDELMRWKFELKDLPKVQEVKFRDQVMRDYSATDKFFVDHLLELNNVIASTRANSTKDQATEQSEVLDNQDDGQEVPF